MIDTLYVLNTVGQGGTKEVTFELGARKPQAFGPGPTFIPFTTNDFYLPPNLVPNFLDMGEGNGSTGCKNAFEINKTIPETGTLTLLVLVGTVSCYHRLPCHRLNDGRRPRCHRACRGQHRECYR